MDNARANNILCDLYMRGGATTDSITEAMGKIDRDNWQAEAPTEVVEFIYRVCPDLRP